MSDIFISYASENRYFALQIEKRLKQFFNIWIDREVIEGGMDWKDAIEDGVVNCTVFIVIITPESNESDWVKRETLLAEQKDKLRIPILLDGDLPFHLLDLQYVDFQGDFEGGFRDLLEALNKNLQPEDKTRDSVNQLLGEAIRAQLNGDVTIARNFVGQALAIQPDLSTTVESFWENLNQIPSTNHATLLQSQLDEGAQLIEETVKPVPKKPDEKSQRFDWTLRLKATSDILDQIECVHYELHHTFKNPKKIIRDPKSHFQLRFNGWGTFEIPIIIRFKDGSSMQTSHQLQFP
jgi:hypothetical protein